MATAAPPTPTARAHAADWAVDADPQNDPAWPMRDTEADPGRRLDWARPAQQTTEAEILRSNEHVRMPAVFGDTLPPAGLSGVLRRRAFRFSVSQWGHWLLLMLADRINVVEGLVDDLRRGRLPNLVAERGLRAELRHDPQRLAARALLGLAAAGAAVMLVRRLARR